MKPWRAVTYITTRETRSGGIVWILDLECGHIAVRHGGNFGRNPVRAITRPIRLAPHKVRCLTCEKVPV